MTDAGDIRDTRAGSESAPAGYAPRVGATVAAALGSRIWQFLAGPVTVLLIARYFSPEEQGFFYAFSGYLGIQTFFELGLSGILITVAGHEYALVRGGSSEEAAAARGRLGDLLGKSVTFYSASAVAFALISGVTGALFFARQQPQITWLAPWLVVVATAAASLWLTPWLALLEATGSAVLVYRARLVQAILGSLAVWLALALGLGLWTAVVASAVQLVVQAGLVFVVQRPQLFTLLAAKTTAVSIAWRRSVLPLQWRIALQGIALYLATQALTLVLMETQAPEVAGRWGMTWTILLALQSMATAWLTAAFPHATQLAAERRWSGLRGYWVRTGLAAGALLAVGIAGFAITLQGLAIMQWNLADRFIAPRDVLLFGIGMIAYHTAACLGYVVRAQRRESLYWAATLGQALVAAGCWYGCARAGVSGLCVAYAAINLLLVLPLHALAWWLDRRSQVAAARAP